MNLSSPAGLGFCGTAIPLSRAKPGDGRALLSCLCSGGFIPPSSFYCTGAALLCPVWAGSMPSRAGAAVKPFACVLTIAALEVWQSTRAGRLRETTPWTLLPRCPAPLPLKATRARPSAPVLSFADSEALQPPFYSREESGASCRTQRGKPRHSPRLTGYHARNMGQSPASYTLPLRPAILEGRLTRR